ncbi:hypothetical protein ABO01nite_28000 [Asaia bogorensis NBRC 16594]|uniref:Uncharacterized protein n=1 Tax=Asaia bogorensis NBRC 16594 TaxID=1231624 RepID=A0AAN4U3P9_9PROT|nr:hypothetical protein ABO01nite_28000 [Asaia bogorensis NBRC 16594]
MPLGKAMNVPGNRPTRYQADVTVAEDPGCHEQILSVARRAVRYQWCGHSHNSINQVGNRKAAVAQEAAALDRIRSALPPSHQDASVQKDVLRQTIPAEATQRFGIGEGLGRNCDHIGDQGFSRRMQEAADPLVSTVSADSLREQPAGISLSIRHRSSWHKTSMVMSEERQQDTEITQIDIATPNIFNDRVFTLRNQHPAFLEVGPACLYVFTACGKHRVQFGLPKCFARLRLARL